jgi:hypothetical protein
VGRTLVVLFFCAGIAVLGLLGGGEHRRATARRGQEPMTGYFPPDMPRYPEVRELPAGPRTEFGGSQMRMSFFTTDDEPARIAGFYGRFWRSRRLFVREDITHLGGVVSAIDEAKGFVYQVLIMSRGGHSVVFPSVTQHPMAAGQRTKQPPPVALFPESRVLYSLASRDEGLGSQIVLAISEEGLHENLKHYRSALVAAGYQAENDPARKDQGKPVTGGTLHVMVYRDDAGAEITVNLTALDEDRVRVHIMKVED